MGDTSSPIVVSILTRKHQLNRLRELRFEWYPRSRLFSLLGTRMVPRTVQKWIDLYIVPMGNTTSGQASQISTIS